MLRRKKNLKNPSEMEKIPIMKKKNLNLMTIWGMNS